MEENHPTTSSDITHNHEDDCKVTWTHPSHIFQRLIALFLMCLIGFGKYLFSCIYSIMKNIKNSMYDF